MIIEALVGLFIITSLVYFIFVRLAEKKEEKFQTVFSMRQAGMTFGEIANKTGFKSLHQCRNYYMDQVADLEM